uniref:Uncharacterized protein n=1 Tax=Nelumbo nucifera TaxID=4432 RepID=A0A822XLV0_NELNU|nr:TPA_asm: hypothetical protein HUJ06_019971 [Nelumbo nucifera]
MKCGDPDLAFTLRLKHNRGALHGSDTDASSTPRKLKKYFQPFHGPVLSSDGEKDFAEKNTSSGDEEVKNIRLATRVQDFAEKNTSSHLRPTRRASAICPSARGWHSRVLVQNRVKTLIYSFLLSRVLELASPDPVLPSPELSFSGTGDRSGEFTLTREEH